MINGWAKLLNFREIRKSALGHTISDTIVTSHEFRRLCRPFWLLQIMELTRHRTLYHMSLPPVSQEYLMDHDDSAYANATEYCCVASPVKRALPRWNTSVSASYQVVAAIAHRVTGNVRVVCRQCAAHWRWRKRAHRVDDLMQNVDGGRFPAIHRCGLSSVIAAQPGMDEFIYSFGRMYFCAC